MFEKQLAEMQGCLIDIENDLFFMQVNPAKNTTKILAKNSGTQEKLQNLVRSKKWKTLLSYHRRDCIENSHYRHFRGCWRVDMSQIPHLEALMEFSGSLKEALNKAIYKSTIEENDNDEPSKD